MRTALTIAGSDSGGRAGIHADLLTFAAHGIFATAAVTTVTAQHARGVLQIEPVAPALVRRQIDAAVADAGADATKIGMLARVSIVETVAGAIHDHALRHVVLDTVLRSSTGTALLDDDGVAALAPLLFPLVDVVTANVPEAEALTGLSITSVDDAREAARVLVAQGARAAIVKGGHLEGPAVDVLFDGRDVVELHADRIHTRGVRGTGCTFASALAARLALGDDLIEAASAAKIYITGAITHAPEEGRGRLAHFWRQRA